MIWRILIAASISELKKNYSVETGILVLRRIKK